MKNHFISMALIVLPGLALAATPTFDEVDVNADGVLSQQEVNAVMSDLDFGRADKNGDGALSQEEYAQAMQEQGKS